MLQIQSYLQNTNWEIKLRFVEGKPDHARLSPSTFKHRAICPGWIKRENQDTTAADEGTFLHKQMETFKTLEECLASGVTLTEEQVGLLRSCFDYVNDIEGQVLLEAKLPILDGRTYGSADRVVFTTQGDDKVAHLIDYKFGKGAVDDASENLQGMAYTLGLFEQVDELDFVKVHFLLPRRDEVTTHTWTRKDVPILRLRVISILERVEHWERTQDERLLNPTDTGTCDWCGRLGHCPRLAAYAFPMVVRYHGLPEISEVHASRISSPEAAAEYLPVVQLLEKMVESAKRHLTQLAFENGGLFDKDGNQVYRISERAGVQSITNSVVAYPLLRQYLEPEEIVSASKITLGTVIDLIRAKTKRGHKDAIEDAVRSTLAAEGCLSSGEPSPILVRVKKKYEQQATLPDASSGTE